MIEDLINGIDPIKFRDYLRDELVDRCKRNHGYSLRAFARDISVDHSTLSKILSGKRAIGKKFAKKLVEKLNLDISEVESLRMLEVDGESTLGSYEQLTLDTFAIISDWYHYAILELLRVDEYNSDPIWISKALNISEKEAKTAIDRLLRVGFIEKSSCGALYDVSGGKTTNISGEMGSSALRKMQKQLLAKSIEGVDEVDYELRNNTSLTMAINTELIPEAVKQITIFRRKMGRLLSRGSNRDEVYNLSIALCPLSNISAIPEKV